MTKRGLYVFLILSALLLFHGLNNYYILSQSRYCLNYDSVDYLDHITQIAETLNSATLTLKSFFETCDSLFDYTFKPPLFFLTAVPFLLFGINKDIIAMSNLLYFALLLFATYGIGTRLYNHRVGILSAFLVSMFPVVFTQSRVIMADLALTSMVALTLYLFILNKFHNIWFSLLTGLVIGLGALTKQTYFIFLAPILLYPFLEGNIARNNRAVRNFALSLIIGLLIAITYYTHAPLPISYYQHSLQYRTHPDPFFYIYALFNHQLFPVFSILFIASIALYIKKKKYFFPVVICALAVLFSIPPSKQYRFMLPIFPWAAVMIAGSLSSLLKVRRIYVISLVLFALVQYGVISYGGFLPKRYNPAQNILSELPKFGVGEMGFFQALDEGDWYGPAGEIVKIVNENAKKNKTEEARVLFIGQTWRIHSAIRYLCLVQKKPVQATVEWVLLWGGDRDWDSDITQWDVIILEKMLPQDVWADTRPSVEAFERQQEKFTYIKSVTFPDNSLGYAYVRSKE